MSERIIDILAERLKEPLPGTEAQFKMSHASRKVAVSVPDNARIASVLALFYPKPDDWHLVLIERTSHNPKDRHKGQISFPGGRYEEGDGSLDVTALREAEEEIGVSASSVNLLGSLTELYIPVSNYKVNPYVGYTTHTPSFVPEKSEVASILEVPVSKITDPAIIKTTSLTVGGGFRLNDVPYFDVSGKIVWGATAMMLSELLDVIRQS